MKTMTRLTLLRHGTTGANTRGLFLGATDAPLSDVGELEVRRLAERLRAVAAGRIVTSDLARARQTAEQVRALQSGDCPIVVEPGIREMHLGDFEGMEASRVRAEHLNLITRWRHEPTHVRMPGPGAETLFEVQTRAVAAIRRQVAEAPGTPMLVVSHTFVILALLCHAMGMPLSAFRRWHVDRASITALEHWGGPAGGDEAWVLRGFNDTAHLD